MKGQPKKLIKASSNKPQESLPPQKKTRIETSKTVSKSPQGKVRSTKDRTKKGFARRTGDSADTTSLKKETPAGRGKTSENSSKSPLGKKSPKIQGQKQPLFSKNNIAPEKKLTRKNKKASKRGIPKKEIEIVIETPKNTKGKISKKSSKNLSKAKQRMKALTKNEEEIKPETPKKISEQASKQTNKVQIRGGRKEKLKKETEDKQASVSSTKRERSRHEKEKPLRKAKEYTKLKKAPAIPMRTPTKKFAKEKTPSPQSPEEETEKKAKKKAVKVIPIRRNALKENVKEEPSSPESEVKSSSSDEKKEGSDGKKKSIKHQLSYSVDTRGISDEISKLLKKIEDKKRKSVEPDKKSTSIKKKRLGRANPTAEYYNFKLQSNPNIKVTHHVKFSDLAEKISKTHSDILLAIIEIATNSEYYCLSPCTSSKIFWEDVIKYEELKEILGIFKAETLRKYWRYISSIKQDISKISDLVKRHKNFLDGINIKLLGIIGAVREFFNGKFDDFEQSVKHMQIESTKIETFEETQMDTQTGETKSIKIKKTTTTKRPKWDASKQRTFIGNNFSGAVEEVLGL
jgi:hypothetical protein